MRRVWIPVVFAALAACSTSHEASSHAVDAGAPDRAGIGTAFCDGSSDIRLGMWTEGGSLLAYTHPFGWEFAFVDGRCRYVASADADVGVASGVLDAEQVEQLAREVGYARIAELSSHRDEVCFEGANSVISDGAHEFGCGCECDDGSPPGLADADAASHAWIGRLVDQGELSTGPVRVAAIKYDGGGPYADSPTWTLARPIEDLIVPLGSLTEDAGTVIDDAEDARALRGLRTLGKMRGTAAWVADAMQQYYVLVRDELPSATDAAVHAFRAKRAR